MWQYLISQSVSWERCLYLCGSCLPASNRYSSRSTIFSTWRSRISKISRIFLANWRCCCLWQYTLLFQRAFRMASCCKGSDDLSYIIAMRSSTTASFTGLEILSCGFSHCQSTKMLSKCPRRADQVPIQSFFTETIFNATIPSSSNIICVSASCQRLANTCSSCRKSRSEKKRAWFPARPRDAASMVEWEEIGLCSEAALSNRTFRCLFRFLILSLETYHYLCPAVLARWWV